MSESLKPGIRQWEGCGLTLTAECQPSGKVLWFLGVGRMDDMEISREAAKHTLAWMTNLALEKVT